MNDTALASTDIHQLKLHLRGKVRDVYLAGPHDLLIVATDRLSAFDVVLPTPIPGKGALLTAIARFWFEKTAHIIPNHLTNLTAAQVIGEHPQLAEIERRSMVVKRLKPLPFEAIVRGYLAGSGWKDYQQSQAICGVSLPSGMEQSAKLPQPIFTPSSKAGEGHDENIDMATLERTIGAELARKIRAVSLSLYQFAARHAAERGIILADTKFEFGLDETGSLTLMDEVFTPDSSRFWPAESYCVGMSPQSYDKQYVRDYLESLSWNKVAPGPELPDEVVAQTQARYIEAYETLTGQSFEA